MKRNNRTITIQDVAAAAGVSVSTVSRVLNDKVDVSTETCEKVQCVIEKLGYTSSLAARGMRSHHTHVIGLVMPDVFTPYCHEVMEGVNHVIAQTDYDLIIYTSGDIRKYQTSDQGRRHVMLLNGSIADGVIIAAPPTLDISTQSPLVVIDPNTDEVNFPGVIATNREGALDAMRYLVELGHRRIGYITGRLELVSAIQRLEGYKEGLAAAGIPLDEELIQTGDYTVEIAIGCANALLALEDRPTAIFAANDMTAMGIYQAAYAQGLRIPQDLSVIGFDNLRGSLYLDPPLTTVDQSIIEMSKMATEMILKLVKGEPLEKQLCLMPTRLVTRKSCQPLC